MPTRDPIREPGIGRLGDASPPPTSSTPPRHPTPEGAPATLAEQSRVLPIVYGTCKVPANLIEKFPPTAGNYPGWTNSTSYKIGQRVTNRGHVYEALTNGISGTTGGPTGTEASITDGTVTWKHVQQLPMPVYSQYFAAALCEGEVVGAVSMWWDKEKLTAHTPELPGKNLTLVRGVDAANQTVPASLDQSGYQHTAVLLTWAAAQTFTGTQKELPEIALELKGVAFGATTPDVNPADIVADLLTHARRGCGLPSSIVGDTITGAGGASYRTYCDALGLRLSLLLDSQQTVLQILTALFLATNTEACWSEGELKCVPLGDQATTSPVYGATNYVPHTTALYNLGVDDFADKARPVRVSQRSDADCFNAYPVEYTDRAQGYARVTVEDPEVVDVHDRGARRAAPVALRATFPDGTKPVMLSRIFAQRSLHCRNTYAVKLPWRYVVLEPLDIVTLTEPELGLNLTPVRILSIAEDADVLSVTAEDFPAGVAAAAGYAPQASDGYVPQETRTTQEIPSVLDGVRVGIAPGIVSETTTTRGANVDNLWPNPTSESAPPTGVTVLNDGSSAEYDYRVNAGTGAFAGAWVRQLAAGAGGSLALPLSVPCAPGDSFLLTTATKRTVGTGQHGVSIAFYDKDGAQVGATTTAWKSTATWDQATCSASAPAGTVSARLSLVVAASTTAQFDSLYARRQVSHAVLESVGYGAVRSADYSESGGNPTNGCKLDLTAGGVTKFADNRFQVGGYMFSTPWFRALRALDGTAVSDGGSGVTWYRGNIDPSTAGAGAPIIHDATYGDRLTIYSPGTAGRVTFSQPTTLAMFGLPLRIIIQPKANTDNLDSLRRIKIVAFTSLGEQMGNPLHIPITDRLYKAAGTPGHSDNQNVIEGWFWLAGSVISAIYGYSPYCFNGYLRVTLYNAYGASAERDFGPNGNVTTTALTPGATIPNASAPASSEGGGGSTICPAPQTRIRLASGALVAAADLWDGAEVLGADDRDPSQALTGIVRRPALGWARHRYAVALDDGRVLRFSQGHRLAATRGWVPVEALRAGDELLGEQPGAVQSVRDEGFGQVMSFVVEGSHTYMADGVLSHNTKVSVP